MPIPRHGGSHATHASKVPPDVSAKQFAAFAREYGALTNREAYAIFAKNDFWETRNGVTRYRDEPKQSG